MQIKNILRHVRDNVFFKSRTPLGVRMGYVLQRVWMTKVISVEDLSRMTLEWASTLPKDYGCVIAVPRTGLFVGAIVANTLNFPLSTPEMFPKTWGNPVKNKKILIVDDSAGTGGTLERTRDMLEAKFPTYDFDTGVPIGRGEDKADYVGNVISRFNLEIDLLGYKNDAVIGCDIDGVLCEDPPKTEREEILEAYYRIAVPYKIPRMKIAFLATGRREKWRKITEEWLAEHNVEYDKLIMRKKGESIVEAKCRAILENAPHLYYESSPAESKMISLITGCPVICFEDMTLY